MFIASTVNTTSTPGIDVPVIVLTYGEESCLVQLPLAYEDLKESTMRVFGIEGSSVRFTFRTSTLDICQGRAVKIHESAWEHVRSFIAELQVSISDSKDQKTTVTKNVPSGEVQPISSSSKVHESHGQVPSGELLQDGEQSEDIEYEDLPEAKDEVEAQDSLAGSAHNSDDENDSHSERSLSNKSEGVEYATDEEDRDDVASTTADDIKTEPAGSERELNEYIDRDLLDARSAPGSQPDRQATGQPIKTEQLSARGLSATVSGSAIASSQGQIQFNADDETPKYVVSISYPPTGDESMFKTRGTYSVKKVLAGACKSFALDFDHAHLKLIVEIEDEDGGELLSDCDNGDTMARAGAVANARFIIVMDEH